MIVVNIMSLLLRLGHIQIINNISITPSVHIVKKITMQEINNMSLYQKIELAIISWDIDGTKTAGTLTREILKIINKEIKNKENAFSNDER